MRRRIEKHVKQDIKKYLNTVEGLWYYMPPASVYGQRGIPDFVGCYKGKFFGIEAKSPEKGAAYLNHALTPLQIAVSKQIVLAEGAHFVVYNDASLDEFKKWAAYLTGESK